MPFDANTPHRIIQIAAYVCTDQGAAVANAVVQRNGGDKSTVHGGGLSGAGRMSDSLPSVDIVLTEIGNIPVDMACECVSEICATGADVIVLGKQTDIETYRALRKAGALDYFTFPVDAEDILSAGRNAPKKQSTALVELPKPAMPNPVIAVVGCNGGVGASLLAQNLAFHASQLKNPKRRIALLDADLQFGSQAIDLDRSETVGLFEALKAPERVDPTFLNATMDHVTDRFSLYSHQVRTGQDAQYYAVGLSPLVAPLRSAFDALVVDLPRTSLMQQNEMVAQFDALILVIPAGFAGVNAATRMIERVTSQHPDIRIIPVLSEVRKDAGLSPKDVTTTIGYPITVTLPHCDKALARAYRAARPVIESQPRGPYATAVGTLWTAAMAQSDSSDRTVRKPLLKRVFG